MFSFYICRRSKCFSYIRNEKKIYFTLQLTAYKYTIINQIKYTTILVLMKLLYLGITQVAVKWKRIKRIIYMFHSDR